MALENSYSDSGLRLTASDPGQLIELLVTPFHRLFLLSDARISYPHTLHEHVPPYSLLVLSIALPLGAILAVLACSPSRPSPQKAHLTILSLFISLALTAFLTDVLKNAIGRPRPDLIARCKARKGTSATELVGIEVCTETSHHVLHDGWRSFPSGHSSFSFAGLGYLSLFLTGHLRVFVRRRARRRGDGPKGLLLVIQALAPLLGAVLIAISRLEDYRHDIWDVSAGSLLGLSMAYYSYRRYFPSPWSRRAGAPLGLAEEEEARAFGNKMRTDEEAAIGAAGDFELDDFDEEDGTAREKSEDEERMLLQHTNRDADPP
ncbi:MAG: hypothetical protein Q9160_002998 [Pyrenula sp. 1 TL-2023]